MSITLDWLDEDHPSTAPESPATEAAYPPPIGHNNPPEEELPDLLAGYVDGVKLGKIFKVTSRTIRTWTRQPDGLPYLDLGRRRLYHLDKCREWLASRLQQTNPPKRRR